MSRRHHHGRPHHARHKNDPQRAEGVARQAPPPAVEGETAANARPVEPTVRPDMPTAAPNVPSSPQPTAAPIAPTGSTGLTNGHATNGELAHQPINGAANGRDERPNGCTAPQLRRFIKSRPYVPMHELRRRFAIDGTDDDVTQVRLEDGHVYVGLPQREGTLLGELLRGGEIGYELSFDPRAPIVVGVYPMRPVPRP
jgi:hypothetical protein